MQFDLGGDLLFLPIQCYGGICVVKGTALLRQQQYGNLVFIRPAMYSLDSTKNRPVEVASGRRLDHQRPQLRLLESYCVNTACQVENAATLSHTPVFCFYLFAPTEHLTARPDRPRPAPALTDGQPRNQHSHPAGPAFTSVQLCHHSGSIHQQADRVSGWLWNYGLQHRD